jgi:iron complex transport system substrate-binding protein
VLSAPERPALEVAKEETLRLARWLRREEQAQRLVASVEATFAATRAALQGAASRPVYLVNFLDARHVRVYGGQSVFQGVLDAVGLANAWRGSIGPTGFATVGFERLADAPEARLVYLDPLPAESRTTLATSPLWQALPFVRDGRLTRLPPVWSFGSLPSAQRLARLLAETLPDRTAS